MPSLEARQTVRGPQTPDTSSKNIPGRYNSPRISPTPQDVPKNERVTACIDVFRDTPEARRWAEETAAAVARGDFGPKSILAYVKELFGNH